MIQKVRHAIHRHHMLDIGDGVVVAVSGGPDSIALLSVLKNISEEYKLKLVVAHLNHGLRPGPADEEEALVRRLSANMGLPCESSRRDIHALRAVHKKSLEETAREERYRFLETVLSHYKARRIALGHHAGDQAETILMNLLRGSGPEGMRGMQAVREGRFIRPFLGVGRAEIMDYLKEHDLPYLTDLSNSENDCLRNRIRNGLIPAIKKHYNPRLEASLYHMAEIMNVEDHYLRQQVQACLSDRRIFDIDATHQEIRINIPLFLNQHEALQNRMIKQLLLAHARHYQGVGYAHIRDVGTLMRCGQSGNVLHLPFDTEVRREHDLLIIGKRTGPPRISRKAVRHRREVSKGHSRSGIIAEVIEIPGRVRIEEQNVTLSLDFVDRGAVCMGGDRIVYMDYACIVPPLTVRMPRPGDRIHPLGMTGTKKLTRFFMDRKIPARLRSGIPLLVDGQSVIWIVGQTLSERVRLTDKTTTILRIEKN